VLYLTPITITLIPVTLTIINIIVLPITTILTEDGSYLSYGVNNIVWKMESNIYTSFLLYIVT